MSEPSVSRPATLGYAVSNPAVTRPAQPDAGQRRFRCTAWQLKWAGFVVGLVAVFLAVMLVCRYEATGLLFTDVLGQKMLAAAGLILALGVGAGVLAGLLLDKVFAAWSRRHLLMGLIAGLQVFFFVRPVVFVILVGPAAISIANNLAKP